MLTPVLQKNDKKARLLIFTFSFVVFAAVTILGEYHLTDLNLPFDPHIFAAFNAMVNSVVSILLVWAFVAVRKRNFVLHKKLMLWAMGLSVAFLVSYIAHHLLAGEARFGDLNHDGITDAAEKATAGPLRNVYLAILFTHIPLAAIILPFILFTAYHSLTGEYQKHKKLARYTWPLWLYVSITGVVVYFMIVPYYHYS